MRWLLQHLWKRCSLCGERYYQMDAHMWFDHGDGA